MVSILKINIQWQAVLVIVVASFVLFISYLLYKVGVKSFNYLKTITPKIYTAIANRLIEIAQDPWAWVFIFFLIMILLIENRKKH